MYSLFSTCRVGRENIFRQKSLDYDSYDSLRGWPLGLFHLRWKWKVPRTPPHIFLFFRGPFREFFAATIQRTLLTPPHRNWLMVDPLAGAQIVLTWPKDVEYMYLRKNSDRFIKMCHASLRNFLMESLLIAFCDRNVLTPSTDMWCGVSPVLQFSTPWKFRGLQFRELLFFMDNYPWITMDKRR